MENKWEVELDPASGRLIFKRYKNPYNRDAGIFRDHSNMPQADADNERDWDRVERRAYHSWVGPRRNVPRTSLTPPPELTSTISALLNRLRGSEN